MEKELTPSVSLEIISETIRNTKKNFSNNSYYFLLWGWLMIFASIGHFVIIRFIGPPTGFENIGLYISLNWLVFVLVGIILQIIHNKKGDQPVKLTIMDKFMKVLWQSSGGAIIIIAVISIIENSYPAPFILVIGAMSTFVSGVMIHSRSLITGGVFMGASAVATSLVQNEIHILVFAAAIIGGYIIPGYILRKNKS